MWQLIQQPDNQNVATRRCAYALSATSAKNRFLVAAGGRFRFIVWPVGQPVFWKPVPIATPAPGLLRIVTCRKTHMANRPNASSLLSKRLLQGWTMLPEACGATDTNCCVRAVFAISYCLFMIQITEFFFRGGLAVIRRYSSVDAHTS